MRVMATVAVVTLMIGGIALAKDPPAYDKGTLLKMDSTQCGSTEKGGKSITGEILGTDSQSKKTNEVLCPQYTLQADRVTYLIRPVDDKHPALLPLGETAEFRINKDKMKLRVPETNQKEREYQVVSMTLRTDVSDSRSAAKTSE
jgi:hypothetical protein